MAPEDRYTRDELRQADGFPEKGDLCHQCQTRIPQFAEMDDELFQRVISLINSQRSMAAMKELVAKLGCSERFAKIWVAHRGKAKPKYLGLPCPYCGKPLRTSRAKQCPHCLASWHRREPPEPKSTVFSDVREAVASVKAFQGRAEDFRLAVSNDMLDPTGINMAIVTDAVLEKGWIVDGCDELYGYRLYRYKALD